MRKRINVTVCRKFDSLCVALFLKQPLSFETINHTQNISQYSFQDAKKEKTMQRKQNQPKIEICQCLQIISFVVLNTIISDNTKNSTKNFMITHCPLSSLSLSLLSSNTSSSHPLSLSFTLSM